MALPLPPVSVMRTDAATIDGVNVRLTSVIHGHPGARQPWTFYEEIDSWLGPWGSRDYPIAFGKFYCQEFTSNEKLQQNATTRNWVRRTTIRLQELLRDYIVQCLRTNNFAGLSEPRLRQAAFESHAQAYDDGGLAMVVMAAPELIPIVASIPASEFAPGSENFSPSVIQVFQTIGRIAPQAMGITLATLAGPAHNGMFRHAMARDRARFRREMALSRELGRIRRSLQQGKLDHVPWLDSLIRSLIRALNMYEFPDRAGSRYANEIITIARSRRRSLTGSYHSRLESSPEVRELMRRKFPMIFSNTP